MYPRLLGMNIGEKNYDDPDYQARLARLDVVILGFYRGWGARDAGQSMRRVVQTLKRLNPTLLVGQYTVLNEAANDVNNTAENDKREKLNAAGWWLRDADHRQVQWTSDYGAWDINITDWARPDAGGRRYPQWLAERDYRVFFAPVPEFDIWYVDNVMAHPRIAAADWAGAGGNQAGESDAVQQAFRLGQLHHWQAAQRLAPGLLLIGNPDNDLSYPEYRGRLQGAFLETLMGARWSLYTRAGWRGMMQRYLAVSANLDAPGLVGFNVSGGHDDYRLLRFALASCLMGDGYFSYTDTRRGYSGVTWFDEYDHKLGRPLEPPQTKPWQDGIYRRRFSNGMVLVNPGLLRRRVTIEAGYRHLRGKQAPFINDGSAATMISLPASDGVLLLKTSNETTPYIK
ncbi:MAG: hypothetical protein H7234_00260 [Herminiimonas sp.]|nr:hypothetical protein [Herminiimonas sp.]